MGNCAVKWRMVRCLGTTKATKDESTDFVYESRLTENILVDK